MDPNLERLERKLKFKFNNRKLLKRALTHRSVGDNNYERLEFLGDAILDLIISKELFKRFPNLSEGDLSRLRATLVNGEMLAEVAKEMNLGDYLFLGQGELKSGGYRRASILADAFEALLAAIYLDSGQLDAVEDLVLSFYHSRMESADLSNSLKDAKTQLQEFLQAKKYNLPNYELKKLEGQEHDRIFYIECSVKGLTQKTTAKASNRRKAEQRAAKALLDLLKADTRKKN